MIQIPEKMSDLLTREKKAFAYLALVKSDGSPQVTPIWFDFDGTHFLFNTARGRVKDKILSRHPVVAFAITDPQNPYRYIQFSGPVVDETEIGAADEIADLAEKYQGRREYPLRPGEVRVTYKVLPERVQSMG
ncbi:MAG: PPOX class F420-dependent oxidoreductase [Anaerolineaceae bacterium]|nr:PPOX class F420-dependent oxidoreductase [Anaerolineaceae bacterium]